MHNISFIHTQVIVMFHEFSFNLYLLRENIIGMYQALEVIIRQNFCSKLVQMYIVFIKLTDLELVP